MARKRPQSFKTARRNTTSVKGRTQKKPHSKASRTVTDHLSQVREVSHKSLQIGSPTGRHASVNVGLILVLVSAMIIFIAPPGYTLLNTYHEARVVENQLKAEEQRNDELRDELAKWSDEEFIETQARSRIGYVKPGQTRYQVIDPGEKYMQKRLEREAGQPQQPWFIHIQESIRTAGDPHDAGNVISRKGVPAAGTTEESLNN